VAGAVNRVNVDDALLLGGYDDSYRLCYVRGPEGIIVELAEQIG
jgi:hypothetical protein